MSAKRLLTNFSAGPAPLPTSVIKRFTAEFDNYKGSGYSIAECSHRSTLYKKLHLDTIAKIRRVLAVPSEYQVLLLGGGATLQFAMLAYNFAHAPINPDKRDGSIPTPRGGSYCISGAWGKKAFESAADVGSGIGAGGAADRTSATDSASVTATSGASPRIAYDGAPHSYTRLPAWNELSCDVNDPYLHLTSNETINGLQFKQWPPSSTPTSPSPSSSSARGSSVPTSSIPASPSPTSSSERGSSTPASSSARGSSTPASSSPSSSSARGSSAPTSSAPPSSSARSLPTPASSTPASSSPPSSSERSLPSPTSSSAPLALPPLIVDMSSDIMTKPLPVSRFAMIYAGAQKNIGIAGVTIVIIRSSFLETAASNALPPYLSYQTHAAASSLYNTPPTVSIYSVHLVMDWIMEQGGLLGINARNLEKAGLLYSYLDEHADFYRNTIPIADRSMVNVIFTLPNADLTAKFLSAARERRIVGINGHRSVGGCRVSLYNAVELQGVELLIEFMEWFAKRAA